MEEGKNTEIPKWLKHLQENSWEAEILISGGAIFSLFQLNYLIEDWSAHLREMHHFKGHNEIYYFLNAAINGLSVGFLANLLIRGFWIALVCLNYSFPDGINFDKLKVSGRYLLKAQSVNLTNQIIKLDHLSGLLFFGSLSFVLVVAGFIVFIAIYFLSYFIIGFDANWLTFQLYAIPYIVFLFDFLGFGFLRRNKVVGTVYAPIYNFFNYVTLAFLYRPWFQVLFTNIAKWKVYMVAGIFIYITISLSNTTTSRFMRTNNPLESRDYLSDFYHNWENVYENRIPSGGLVRFACIQSDMVSDSHLRVFINYDQWYDELIAKSKNKNLSDLFYLKIDDKMVASEWVPIKRLISNQFGITCYLPIGEVLNGKHKLSIHLRDTKDSFPPFPLIIPFWK